MAIVTNIKVEVNSLQFLKGNKVLFCVRGMRIFSWVKVPRPGGQTKAIAKRKVDTARY